MPETIADFDALPLDEQTRIIRDGSDREREARGLVEFDPPPSDARHVHGDVHGRAGLRLRRPPATPHRHYSQDGESTLRQELCDVLYDLLRLTPEPSDEDGDAYLAAVRAGDLPNWAASGSCSGRTAFTRSPASLTDPVDRVEAERARMASFPQTP